MTYSTRGRRIDFLALEGGAGSESDSDEQERDAGQHEDGEYDSDHRPDDDGRRTTKRKVGRRRRGGLVVVGDGVPFLSLLLDPALPETDQAAKADQVVIPASFLELARAHVAPPTCLCERLQGRFATGVCVAAARRIVKLLKMSSLDASEIPALPHTLTTSLAVLCPVHQGDSEAAAREIARVEGSYSVGAMARAIHEFQQLVPLPMSPAAVAGAGWSVFRAHMYWLVHVLQPQLFPANNPDHAMMVALLPHLLRDLFINFHWHITLRNFRLADHGTGVAQRPTDNYPGFLHVMLHTVLHYINDHSECGKTHAGDPTCAATIDISASLAVQHAVVLAARKVATLFIVPRGVTDIHVVFQDQATLAAHFSVL